MRPRWLTRRSALLAGLGVVLLALTGLLPGSDWSDGAVRVALVALAGALALGVATRRWLRDGEYKGDYDRRVPRAILVALVVLMILGGTGIGLQGTIQYAQGQWLAGRQSFAAAIHEFQRCSNPEAQASTYFAWGQQLHAQGQFQPALDKYAQALRITHNSGLQQRSTQAEAKTYYDWGNQQYSQGQYDAAARSFLHALQLSTTTDLTTSINAALAQNDYSWGTQQENQGQYAQAITQYLAALPYASSANLATLTTQLQASLARVYYTYGQQLETNKQYDQAITAYSAIFPYTQDASQVTRAREALGQTYLAWITSQVANKQYTDAITTYQQFAADSHTLSKTKAYPAIHRTMAKAYLALARKAIAGGDCYNGGSYYDQLIAHYGDTSEGKTALAARAQPQNVSGRIVEYSTGNPAPFVRVFLSAQWSVSIFGFTASDDYSTTSDAKGKFTFGSIPTGGTEYLISYIDNTGSEAVTVFENQFGLPSAANAVTVEPYCPVDAGTVERDPPTSGGTQARLLR